MRVWVVSVSGHVGWKERAGKNISKSSSPLSLHFAGEKKQHGAVLNGTVIFFFKKIKMNL
jgi:hypothetical protein